MKSHQEKLLKQFIEVMEQQTVSEKPKKSGTFIIPKYEVPADEEGYKYKEFFKKFGFVVVRDILTKEECEDTINDIWNILTKVHPLNRQHLIHYLVWC
jgi:hypothetical protein